MLKTLIRFIPYAPWRDRLLKTWDPNAPLVAVVRLSGIIGPTAPFRGGLNLAGLAGDLEQAFSLRGVKAVALAINSPGGSPVQSSLIHKRIRALAAEKEIPVYAFVEDVAASGGYWLACAGDEIYADESSILGSIGVIMAGFGFQRAIEKLGVERRVHTAGEHKAMLDPFRPEDPEEVKRIEAIQQDIHESFKALVRDHREGKLKAPEEELFTGAFWAGRRALELGLIDGLSDLRAVLREKYGDKVRLRVVGGAKPWWRRRPGAGGGEAGLARAWEPPALAEGLLAGLEARSLWSRFGL